jgi:hypothetical protein
MQNNNILEKHFYNSPLYSMKWKQYFEIYLKVFGKFRKKKITFVEIGTAMGGSLFMWRKFFGYKARIIGIDLNPEAKKLEKFGFEIYIGDQAEDNFWKNFYKKIGKIDILLDDGGHTNIQQISTLYNSINHIRDEGLIVIEDTHASYISKGFNNPSKFSFINYSKQIIDSIHKRCPTINRPEDLFSKKIYSITYYESIAIFEINKSKCNLNYIVHNKNKKINFVDYRHKSNFIKFNKYFSKYFNFFTKFKLYNYFVKKISGRNIFYKIINRIKTEKYFKIFK